jgi:hypothetical protein
MSGEKVQAFIDRFPTPISFYEGIKARRLEEEEVDEDSDGPPKKKRKKADGPDMWVMNEAGKGGSRGIKQKISSDLYNIWVRWESLLCHQLIYSRTDTNFLLIKD